MLKASNVVPSIIILIDYKTFDPFRVVIYCRRFYYQDAIPSGLKKRYSQPTWCGMILNKRILWCY